MPQCQLLPTNRKDFGQVWPGDERQDQLAELAARPESESPALSRPSYAPALEAQAQWPPAAILQGAFASKLHARSVQSFPVSGLPLPTLQPFALASLIAKIAQSRPPHLQP